MNTSQRILKNVATLLFSEVASNLVMFAAYVYVTRTLGPQSFGKVSFAVAITIHFTPFIGMGLPLLGTRMVARDRQHIQTHAGTILSMRLFLAIISIAVLFAIAHVLHKPEEIRLLIICYSFELIPLALFLDWTFQGVEKMEFIGAARVIASIAFLGGVLYFVQGPEHLIRVPVFKLIATGCSSVFLFLVYYRNFGLPRINVPFSKYWSLFIESFPIGLTGLIVQAIYYTDSIMLGYMASDAIVGYYNAAYKIIFFFYKISGAYVNSIFPVLSKEFHTASSHNLKTLQALSVKMMVSVALPLAVAGTILARVIIILFYGKEYSGSIIAFQILIWAVAFSFVNTIYAWGLWACDNQKQYLKVVSIQAAGNLMMNFLLIPRYGIVGAGIATVAAEMIGVPLYYKEFCKILKVTFVEYLFRPFIASLGMGGVIMMIKIYISTNLVVLIIGGTLAYGVFLFLMNGVTTEDIKRIRLMFQRKKTTEPNTGEK